MSSRQKAWRGPLVCALAFVVLFGYAIARPATESMFLDVYGSAKLPLVWAAVAATALAVVALYNACAARFPLGRVMVGSIAASAATLCVGGLLDSPFVLYVWKDVHIVVLLEALWSFANLAFEMKTARWAYGVFCAAGSIGGVSGNLGVGALAARFGTDATLWLVLPIFAVQVVLVLALSRATGHPSPPKKTGAKLGDFAMLRASPYLGWMLALVGVVQIVITLVDYAYNDAIAAAYPALDARTQVIGQIYAVIDGASLLLQLATGLVLKLLGLRATLLALPALLALVVVSFAAVPRFALMAATKIASKVFDYSLFRAAKEMLYIPLSYAEKTRGKALIDMLTYRVAKGAASLLLLLLVALGTTGAVALLTLAFIALWLLITIVVTRRHADITVEKCNARTTARR